LRRAVFAGILGALAVGSTAAAGLPRGFVGLYGEDAGQLSLQARFGSQTVRRPFEWSRVERSRGRFDFSAYDGFVAGAARAHVDVLPFLIGPPRFRSSRPPNSRSRAMYPPKSNAAFAAFAAAAVRRYGPAGSLWRQHPELPKAPIRSWQIWNEPNIPNWWRSGPSARQYVKLLRAGARAIRQTDPQAEIVAAGLPNSKLGVPFLRYLEAMYRAGAKGSFDTLAIHPYSRNVAGLLSLAESARRVMNRHHDRSRLWVTELGWSTAGDKSVFRVGERGQAERIAASLSGLVAERRALRLRGFILFQWRDAIAPPALGGRDPWPLHAGLIHLDGSPKPGFWAFVLAVYGAQRGEAAWRVSSAEPARISRGTVRLSPLGFAAVGMGCRSPDPGACAGTLRLRAARSLHCGADSRAAGAELGSAKFRVAVAPAIVPVRLTPGARRLARCAGRIHVSATAGSARAGTVKFVIRAR
jgi:polysaccharide biosynthesis protein PslG